MYVCMQKYYNCKKESSYSWEIFNYLPNKNLFSQFTPQKLHILFSNQITSSIELQFDRGLSLIQIQFWSFMNLKVNISTCSINYVHTYTYIRKWEPLFPMHDCNQRTWRPDPESRASSKRGQGRSNLPIVPFHNLSLNLSLLFTITFSCTIFLVWLIQFESLQYKNLLHLRLFWKICLNQ